MLQDLGNLKQFGFASNMRAIDATAKGAKFRVVDANFNDIFALRQQLDDTHNANFRRPLLA